MEDKFSFTDWLEKESTPLGLFSLERRSPGHKAKVDFKIGRSTRRPSYSQFVEINKLFKAYVPKVVDPKQFMQLFYKMELTGAQIKIDNRECIIVEERKNSILTISKDNRVRTYIKAGLKFIFELNNVKYLVFGRNLKLNRFVKK